MKLKRFLFGLSLMGFLAVTAAQLHSAHADIKKAPFIPEVDCRFNALEQGQTLPNGCSGFPIGSADGHYLKQLVKATYDFSKVGGSSTVSGGYDLGVPIPASAIITRSFIYSITKPTTSASGVLGFYCSNSTLPEFLGYTAAASFPSAGAVAEGIQTGTATNMSVISSKCDVHAKINTGPLTAGKVVLYVEYVVHQ